MKRLFVCLFVSTSVIGLFWVASPQAADNNADDVKTFMRAKLEYSKNVLEGLATENFELIAKDSQQLTLLSLDADWQVLQTPEYAQLSLAFRKTSQTLTEAAQKKNLDGATLAYVELTLKCVQCHKYVRSVEMARISDPENRFGPNHHDSAALVPQTVAPLSPIGLPSRD